MAKISSFEAIGTAVAAVVERAKNGTLSDVEEQQVVVQATMKVAGLDIVPPPLLRTKTDDTVERLCVSATAFSEDATALEAQLAEAGITSKVILPAGLWDQIIKEANLYTFSPNHGNVVVSYEFHRLPGIIAERLSEKKRDQKGAFNFLASVVGILATLGMFYSLPSDVSQQVFVGELILSAGACLITFLLVLLFFNVLFFNESREVRKVVKKAGGIHAFLWPNFMEPNSSLSIRVSFPTPPKDVQEMLYLADKAGLGNKLRLTVEKGAIAFEEDPLYSMIARTRRIMNEKRKEEERQRVIRAQEAADPIVTLTGPRGKAVAVLAQYGDFPIEKAAVERAVKAYSFI